MGLGAPNAGCLDGACAVRVWRGDAVRGYSFYVQFRCQWLPFLLDLLSSLVSLLFALLVSGSSGIRENWVSLEGALCLLA